MKNFELLNNREIKRINNMLKEQFGNEFNFKDYLVFKTPRNRVFIVSKDFSKIDTSKLKINNVGLYFLSLEGKIRLSIDGSQIFKVKKNVLELNEKEFEKWMNGAILDIKQEKGYFVLKHKDHYLGCGKSTGEKILNFIPKERRVVF